MFKLICKKRKSIVLSMVLANAVSAMEAERTTPSLNSLISEIQELVITDLNPTDQSHLRATCTFWRDKIDGFNEKNLDGAVILLGAMGSGKSTLAHIMKNHSLTVTRADDFMCKMESDKVIDGIKIIHRLASRWNKRAGCFDYPNRRIIIECPAILNKDKNLDGLDYFLHGVIPTYNILKGNIKVILSIEFYSFLVSGAEDVRNSLRLMTEMFQDQNELNKSMHLVVTKTNSHASHEGVLESLNVGRLTKKEMDFVNHLRENPHQFEIMPKPTCIGQYSVSEGLLTLLNAKEYVSNPVINEPEEKAILEKRWRLDLNLASNGKGMNEYYY